MKLMIEHRDLPSTHDVDALVEERILALEPRLQIDEARVRLECRFDESPAFSVRVHLVTPGPDVTAAASDHTIRAAITKAMDEVERVLDGRTENRHRQLRGKRQQPAHLRTKLSSPTSRF